jgi:phosphate transport system substrate-binding protein
LRSASNRLARLVALCLALTLVAAACGDDDDEGDATATTEAASGSASAASETESESESGSGSGSAAAGDVSGEVNVSGSSTVEPISVRVAEGFEEIAPDVVVNVDGPGTGDGFELFCNGETDISDASRPISEEEVAACEESGVEFIELKVAFDGIAVLTNPANETVECLTFADLYALVGPEAEGTSTWSDAAELAGQLGSTTELPDAPLEIVGPGEESGTYDSFIELVFGDIAEAQLEAGAITEDQAETTRPDYQSSPNDNTIIQGIEGSDSSLGWVGFAFAEEAGEGVKELEIDGGDGCVAPSDETIADGSYPISRPLFIYVSTTSMEENPAVAAYVEYYMDEGISAVDEVGYVALPEDQLTESREALESMTTGTRET